MAIGDLYFRMVKCLYTKYTLRKDIKFEKTVFHQVLISVGNLALQTLKSGNPLIPIEDILGMAGEFAFEYGLFTGHEDLEPSTDPTPGMCVTYAHRSLEEFFWSLGFLQALDDGKNIDDILGSDCEEPMFMMNPLIFTFCLWLSKECFGDYQGIVYDKLVTYAAQQIDFYMLDIGSVRAMYPAMYIKEAVLNKDSLKLEFFERVFEKCKHIRQIHVKEMGDEVEGVLEVISHSLVSKLTVLSIIELHPNCKHSSCDANSNDLIIYIDSSISKSYHKVLKTLLANSNILQRNPQVCAAIEGREPS